MNSKLLIFLCIFVKFEVTVSQNNATFDAFSEQYVAESNVQNQKFEVFGKNFSKKWLTDLFLEAKMEFDMTTNVNEKCAADFGSFKHHLFHNQTIWAVRSWY